MTVKKVESAKKLTPAQFWLWRAKHLMVCQQEDKLKIVSLEKNRAEMEAQNQQLKANLFSARINEIKATLEISRNEFQEARKQIEVELGTTLSDKMINEETFELLEIPSDNDPRAKVHKDS